LPELPGILYGFFDQMVFRIGRRSRYTFRYWSGIVVRRAIKTKMDQRARAHGNAGHVNRFGAYYLRIFKVMTIQTGAPNSFHGDNVIFNAY